MNKEIPLYMTPREAELLFCAVDRHMTRRIIDEREAVDTLAVENVGQDVAVLRFLRQRLSAIVSELHND